MVLKVSALKQQLDSLQKWSYKIEKASTYFFWQKRNYVWLWGKTVFMLTDQDYFLKILSCLEKEIHKEKAKKT